MAVRPDIPKPNTPRYMVLDTIHPHSLGSSKNYEPIQLYFPETCIFVVGDVCRLNNRDQVRIMAIETVEDFFETYTVLTAESIYPLPGIALNYIVYDVTRLYSTTPR